MSSADWVEPARRSLRQHRFAFAFLLLLAAIPFAVPLLKQEVFTVRDHFDYFQPMRWFTAEELRAGRLPLWNPYSGSGEPWLANPQTGVFYPPAWLFLVLPFPTAYMLHLLGHMVLLGWGAYLFLAQRISRGGALVAAVALIFSGPMLSLLDISNNLATLAWIPIALWCAAAGAWRRGGSALALAFLGGEPFLAAVGALLYSVVGLAASGASAAVVDRARRVLLAGLVALGLSAVQLLPFLEMLRGSDRADGFEAADVLRDSMPLRDWLRVVVPPSHAATGLDPALGQHYIPVVYVGIVTALLALLGLSAMRRKREVAGWAVLLVASIVVAAGPAVLAELPVTLFRYPARMLVLASFAIAALAGIGWDRIRPEKRWADLLVVLVIASDLLLRSLPLLATAPFNPSPVPFDSSVGRDAAIVRTGKVAALQRSSWIAGYLNLYDRRFDADTAAPLAPAEYVQSHRRLLEAPSSEILESFAIGWVLSEKDLPARFQPVARSGTVYAFRVRDPRPMVTHERGGVHQSVRRWTVAGSQVRVTLVPGEAGTVVVRQRIAPGWRAEVDGQSAETALYDGIFRAVAVPEGARQVVWSYRPLSLLIGGGMTLVTLLAMQFRVFVKRSSRRSRIENFSS